MPLEINAIEAIDGRLAMRDRSAARSESLTFYRRIPIFIRQEYLRYYIIYFKYIERRAHGTPTSSLLHRRC
jgi:hypothetical protein